MAETSNFVIQYLADISNVQKRIREIERLNKTAASNLGKEFSKGINVVSSRLKKLRDVPIFDAKGIAKGTKTLAEFETVVRSADGKLTTISETGQVVNGTFGKTNTVFKDSSATSRTFGQNLATLAKRAALTIPVWFALRGAITGLFSTIKNGIRDIASFDRALQKLRRNISATSTNVEKDFKKAREEIEKFSLRTGKSVEEVTNSIQKFATVGFDFETSLEGGLRATQLAVTLFGDATDTANAFARSLRVLTEGIDDPAEQQRAIAEALALTDELWQTNAFEVNEFSNNLEKFAGTAKIANLSIEDTLTLLATLSTAGLGNRAGRLLRSTLLRSLGDIENITKVLNLQFDPQNQPTIVFIQELVSALKTLRTTENVPVELSEVLGDLFSVRSTEVLAGLTALETTLKENLALTPDIQKFDQTFEDILKTTGSLAEQFTNVNKELGKAFVTGLVGAEDFQSSLKELVEFLKSSVGFAQDFGSALRDLSIAATGTIFALGFVKIQDSIKATANEVSNLSLEIQKAFNQQLDAENINKLIDDIREATGRGIFDSGLAENVINALEFQLELIDERVEKEKEIVEIQKEQEGQSEKQQIAENKRKSIAELVLKNELAILRARGARASQITEAEQLLRQQLNIEKTVLQQLEDQLKKEREINEERRLRSELGSDSIKLFRIAENEGIEVARKIGDVLAGNLDFASFVRRGGRELEVFKEQFDNIFEQQQALAFFRGDTVPGARGLRGGGRIPIQEEALRTPIPSVSARASVQQKELINAFNNLRVEDQKVQANRVFITSSDVGGALPNTLTNQNIANLPGSTGGITQGSRDFLNNAAPLFNQNKNLQFGIVVDITGGERVIVGTKEEVARQIADLATPQIRKVIIDNITNNPQSDESKAITSRVEEF